MYWLRVSCLLHCSREPTEIMGQWASLGIKTEEWCGCPAWQLQDVHHFPAAPHAPSTPVCRQVLYVRIRPPHSPAPPALSRQLSGRREVLLDALSARLYELEHRWGAGCICEWVCAGAGCMGSPMQDGVERRDGVCVCVGGGCNARLVLAWFCRTPHALVRRHQVQVPPAARHQPALSPHPPFPKQRCQQSGHGAQLVGAAPYAAPLPTWQHCGAGPPGMGAACGAPPSFAAA